MEYYLLHDIQRVGKIDDHVPYLYVEKVGWVVDNDNLLMDRLMGYDGESIGNTSKLLSIDEISEEQAEKLITNN